MQYITDTELLIVRNLKHSNRSENTLKKLVGRYYLLHPKHVTKDSIFNCLFDIIEKFDLLPHSKKGENIRDFFIYKDSLEPEFDNLWDGLIYRAISVIRMSYISKFPRYPDPSWIRNIHKNSTDTVNT